MGCRSTCSGGFGGTAWINKLPLPILLIQEREWSVCEWHVISCLVVFVYSTRVRITGVWSVQVCLSMRWSCGVHVWATNDCLWHLCFRRSQLISAGGFVCIKASYSRFVCKLAGIFVCFAEGTDEKTAIFQARRRWHTWPVKHVLHLAVQLLPRLWRVGARACKTERCSVSQRKEGFIKWHAKTCSNYSALIDQRTDSSITLTHTVHRIWSLLLLKGKGLDHKQNCLSTAMSNDRSTFSMLGLSLLCVCVFEGGWGFI